MNLINLKKIKNSRFNRSKKRGDKYNKGRNYKEIH